MVSLLPNQFVTIPSQAVGAGSYLRQNTVLDGAQPGISSVLFIHISQKLKGKPIACFSNSGSLQCISLL